MNRIYIIQFIAYYFVLFCDLSFASLCIPKVVVTSREVVRSVLLFVLNLCSLIIQYWDCSINAYLFLSHFCFTLNRIYYQNKYLLHVINGDKNMQIEIFIFFDRCELLLSLCTCIISCRHHLSTYLHHGCHMGSRNCLPFRSTWIHPVF